MTDPLTIIHGDALSSLRALPDESVQCCVTSPPYWGLRDYGTGEWIGGNSDCDHAMKQGQRQDSGRGNHNGGMAGFHGGAHTELSKRYYRGVCGKCGADRVDIQLGLETTPEEYVARLVEIFRELKRVLRSDGTLWLNLGDSYASQAGGYSDNGSRGATAQISAKTQAAVLSHKTRRPPEGLKPKDLVGIPWMVAFALRADGWYLRSDIIWSKPNPMPESVTDRPTKSHEYIFLLSKSERYFYDAEAIKEASTTEPHARNGAHPPLGGPMDRNGHSQYDAAEQNRIWGNGLRNRRSVWTVTTQPFSDAHFATFPPDLIIPCILAGSRTAGKRCNCDEVIETPLGSGNGETDPTIEIGRAGFNRPRKDDEGTRPITRREQRAYAEQMKASPHRAEMASEASTAFNHYIRTDRSGARPLPPALLDKWLANGWLTIPDPCDCPISEADTVLDPFAGSGTTGKVAIELGRKAILIEPKAEYIEMIKRRCQTTIGLPLAI